MSQLQLALRRELAVNAVISPSTAIIGYRNGDIFSSPSSHLILDGVCREASDAYTAQLSSETKEWLQGLSVQGINVDHTTLVKDHTDAYSKEACPSGTVPTRAPSNHYFHPARSQKSCTEGGFKTSSAFIPAIS